MHCIWDWHWPPVPRLTLVSPLHRTLSLGAVASMNDLTLRFVCHLKAINRACCQTGAASLGTTRAAPIRQIDSVIVLRIHLSMVSHSWMAILVHKQLNGIPKSLEGRKRRESRLFVVCSNGWGSQVKLGHLLPSIWLDSIYFAVFLRPGTHLCAAHLSSPFIIRHNSSPHPLAGWPMRCSQRSLIMVAVDDHRIRSVCHCMAVDETRGQPCSAPFAPILASPVADFVLGVVSDIRVAIVAESLLDHLHRIRVPGSYWMGAI